MTRQEAESRTILRCVVGSTVHGLNVQDGIEDRDEMGVVVEPLANVIGFQQFEQFIYRSAAEREGKHDARSKAGDLDLTLYSLRKYCRLAAHGNPTVLILLFAPPIESTLQGHLLQQLAPAFASRQAGKRFLGYLIAQKQRLLGERGQKNVKRPELEEKYGFDTKYAMHMLRLGVQGVEYLQTGRLSLPMPEPDRSWLYDVRIGKIPLAVCLERVAELEAQLKHLIDTSSLPNEPNHGAIEFFLTQVYLSQWELSANRSV